VKAAIGVLVDKTEGLDVGAFVGFRVGTTEGLAVFLVGSKVGAGDVGVNVGHVGV